jgi:C4-dicarboxylate-specific signal transduction histidine kinase
MSLIFASCVLFIIFTNTFREYYLTLLNSQDEVEKSRKGLEEKVKIKTKELKELNENLEKEVEKRTEKIKEQSTDLEKKVNHLEKFNKLTIGRENRMKELKEEIETLKKEKQELEEKLNEK